jgi:DNA polymerase III subunit beta
MMDISVDRDLLLNKLLLVSGAVERRHTIAILSHLLFEVKGAQLSVTATDSEIEIITHLPLIESKTDAKITIPSQLIVDICRSLPEKSTIQFKLQGSRMLVTSNKSRFQLATLPAEEFPLAETGRINVEVSIKKTQLKQLIDRSAFAMAQQDVRYFLNGMLLRFSSDAIQVIASDGHRLAITKIEQSFTVSDEKVVILPRKAVLELGRLLDDSDSELKVGLGDNHMCLSCEDFQFSSKLIDGKFPDYSRVIPKNNDKIVKVNKSLFGQALTRAAILCNEKYNGIRLVLSSDLLKLDVVNPDQDTLADEIPVNYTGDSLQLGFNVNYLMDALAHLPGEEVMISCSDANSSIIIEEPSGGISLYIIMPLRL